MPFSKGANPGDQSRYDFSNNTLLIGGYGDIKSGTKWIGEQGWVWVDRGRFETSEPSWKAEIAQREKKHDLEMALAISPGHQREFLDCVKSRKRTLKPTT